jgi:hypothetical protein
LGAEFLASREAVTIVLFFSRSMKNRDFSPLRIHEPVFVYAVCFVNRLLLYTIPPSSALLWQILENFFHLL